MLSKTHNFTAAAHFFHLPVVLFGERTTLPGEWAIGNFFPKAKSLEPGDSVILDAAPLFSGHLVDTSYSFCFGENDEHSGEVLGHRAVKAPNLSFQLRLQGFDAVSLNWFRLKDRLATSGLGRRTPLWNTLKTSDHKAHDGLWLVEPHTGLGPVGAKWEEILLIEDSKARWLDDESPHVHQWSQIAAGADYRPRADHT